MKFTFHRRVQPIVMAHCRQRKAVVEYTARDRSHNYPLSTSVEILGCGTKISACLLCTSASPIQTIRLIHRQLMQRVGLEVDMLQVHTSLIIGELISFLQCPPLDLVVRCSCTVSEPAGRRELQVHNLSGN